MSGQESPIGKTGQVKEITSLANPVIKEIKALALKKHRDRQNAFFVEGLKLVRDAFEQGWTIRKMIFAKAARGNPIVEKVAATAIARGGTVLVVPEKVLSAITRRDNPQQVIGVFERRSIRLDAIRPSGSDVWVALDRVRDPGNLGTIIRTSDAAGAKGVILIGESTDPFAIEAVRATMGSIFSVPVAHCSESEFLRWRSGYTGFVVGTHLAGAVDYRTPSYRKKQVLLLMGNEQKGLTESLAESCDMLVKIPQEGNADSLNLAVSTGIMLYEIRREALGTPGEPGT